MLEKSKSTIYRWCIVPGCNNSCKRTPGKTFIQVPSDETRRNVWLNAVGRCHTQSKASGIFVCEDHFDLEDDMENYMKWKLVGGKKYMKKTAVPHKFDCQAIISVSGNHCKFHLAEEALCACSASTHQAKMYSSGEFVCSYLPEIKIEIIKDEDTEKGSYSSHIDPLVSCSRPSTISNEIQADNSENSPEIKIEANEIIVKDEFDDSTLCKIGAS